MPSFLHQGLLALVKANAAQLFELARHFDARAPLLLPGVDAYQSHANELPNPAFPGALLHADWVVAQPDALALAVEVQTCRDRLKRYSWLSYAAGVRRLFDCPGWTLAVIPDPELRRWYQQMFEDEARASPWFVEPHMLEPITSVQRAKRAPQRATFAALFHAREALGVACARAPLDALRQLDPVDVPHRSIYRELVLTTLTREQLEELPPELLEVDPHAPLGPMERTNAYYTTGHEDGHKDGVAAGLAGAILTVLERRGQTLDAAAQARLETCRDPEQLQEWLELALTDDSKTRLAALLSAT